MLADKGSFGTSAVAMLEIARAQLPTTSGELQLAPHTTAPEDLGRGDTKPKDPIIPQTGADQRPGASEPSAAPIHRSGGSPLSAANSGGKAATKPGPAAPQHTDRGVKSLLSKILILLGTGADGIEVIHGTTDDAMKILGFVQIAHRWIKRVHGGSSSSISKITYAQLRAVAKYGSYAKKASNYMEAVDQTHTFGKNVHSTLPIAKSIINSDAPWSTKTGKLGTLLAAVSLSSVAQIESAPVRSGISLLRTGAAMAGVDVMHPTFGNGSAYDPRTYMNWQFLNFVETRSVSAFDADTVYLLLHSHIDHN